MESKEISETVKVNDKIPMNILLCGSKIEKVNIQQLFNDQVIKTLKNKTDYEEYIYQYDWKFDFFIEGLGANQLNKVHSKLVQEIKDKDFET